MSYYRESEITPTVCRYYSIYYGLNILDILGKGSKTHNACEARRVIMYFLYYRCKRIYTLKSIAEKFGLKTHSTVLHAIAVARKKNFDVIEVIEEILKQGGLK